MKFARTFTRSGEDPFQSVEMESRHCQISGSGFSMDDVIVPVSWSQNASNVVAQKYFRKAGVPDKVVKVEEEGIPSRFARSEPAEDAIFDMETDVRQLVRRLAGCWTYWGFKKGLFDKEEDGIVFYDELCYTLIYQMWAPNSPQWFNTGLHWAYGITRPPQGHFYYDEVQNKVVASKSAYERPQPHACFIQSVDDDLVNPGGIMDLWVREARLFKYGSGTGTNFSSIRGLGENLSGGGVSSGLMSWLKIGDRAAAGIKSGGTTRRAAKMVLLDCDHPEISEFVNWKVSEEQKVLALVVGSKACAHHLNAIIGACHSESASFDPKENAELAAAILDARAAGLPDVSVYRAIEYAKQGIRELEVPVFDTGWQSEAYNTVSGQQSNNSVGVTAAFLDAVEAGDSWDLIRRTDGGVHSTIPARDLWADICSAAWACADPGLQYQTTMNEWNTCPNDDKIRGSNPCSEYMFLDDTACNLASLNLVKFESEDQTFHLDRYKALILLVTTVLEISVSMSQLPSAVIAKKTWQYRTLGLGYANLGAFLMRRGLPYDSPEARQIAGALTAILSGEAYVQSARLAQQWGAFDRYEHNKAPMQKVMMNHYTATMGGNLSGDRPLRTGLVKPGYRGLSIEPVGLKKDASVPYRSGYRALNALIDTAEDSWNDAVFLGKKYGYRNAQTTCLAPTGTISIEMDCDTTGVEPDFSLVKFKALAGGGGMIIVNQSVPVALKRLGYTTEQVEQIVTYISGTRCLGIFAERLIEHGFSDDMVSAVDRALQGTPHLMFAVSEHVIGRKALVSRTLLTQKALDSGKDLLTLLGFTPEQIFAANEQIIGTLTIEGAPHIRDEHLAIFDCANRCGLKGTRFIAPRAHIEMMGAVQPFLCGAISKTVNMPRDSTLDDVRKVYLDAYRLGLKSVALYRDGSKLSQPLESRLAADLFEGLTPVAVSVSEPEVIERVVQKLVVRYLADRRKLPWKRRGYTQKVVIAGHKMFLRTGEYQDGTLGEVFIDSHKEGAAFRSLLGAFAMSISVGLQHGVPLERFVDLYTFTKWEPNGMVEGDENIKMCTSMIDYVFRNLGVNYLGREELAHAPSNLQPDAVDEPKYKREVALSAVPTMLSDVPIEVNEAPTDDNTEEQMIQRTFASTSTRLSTSGMGREASSPVFLPSSVEIAKSGGYLGDPCAECNEMRLVQNGSCAKCENCGATTGCS